MKSKTKILCFCICMGLASFQSLFAQEGILKELVEQHTTRTLTFYSSTLRMLNLNHDENFDELVRDIDKLQVYVLDSTSVAERSYHKISEAYTKVGFDEYASANGGGMAFSILGKENSKVGQFTGYYAQGGKAFAFYLEGIIPIEKMYSLTQTIQESDFLNPLDLTHR